jgi:Ca2+-binding RTX toxin-like protein
MASNPLASAAVNTDMKWAFPNLENPTIIDLSKTGGQDWWQFRADEDVIFIGADQARTANKLQTDGGRNIVVLGGEYQPQYDSKGATLHFLNLHGSVHVEGVKIDSTKSAQDGIAVAGAPGKQPDVTVQNSVITDIHGTQDGVHGDVFQTHGSVGNMRFYNVTGDSAYQGFFIAPQYSPNHKSADFENVNITFNEYAPDSTISYQYWFLDGDNQTPYPVTLKNVFATERPGQQAENASVWPKAGMGAVRVGDQITFEGLPYKGAITVGEPAKDFGDLSKVGLHFKVDAAGVHTGTIGDGTTTAPAPSTGTGTGSTPATDTTTTDHKVSGSPTNWIDVTDATAKAAGTTGNDQIAGVAGKADTGGLAGGKGDDTYIVDNAGDKVMENAGEGTDTVVSYSGTYTLSANVENLTLAGTTAQNGIGNAGANILTGNAAANVLNGKDGDDLLVGGGGNDTLQGWNGADVMKGGLGNDTYYVSRATDKVVELGGQGNDTVKAAQSVTLGQYVENVELFGSANASATGNSWHNKLTGNDGANTLKGMAGNDVLNGGKGADILVGGTGKDSFVLSQGLDTIKDFKLGEDTLDVRGLLKAAGATSTDAVKDHMLEIVQKGANAEVIAHMPDAEPVKVAIIEHVDAVELAKTSDNWS